MEKKLSESGFAFLITGSICLLLSFVSDLDWILVVGLFLWGSLFLQKIVSRVCIRGVDIKIVPTLSNVFAARPMVFEAVVKNKNRWLPMGWIVFTVSEGKFGEQEHLYPGVLLPGQEVTVSFRFVFSHRGRQSLSLKNVRSRFPFGLSERTLLMAEDFDVGIVWPRQLGLLLPVLGDCSLASSHIGLTRGTGVSDNEHYRDYRSGDPMKTINWRLSAKFDNLVVADPQPALAVKIGIAFSTDRRLWKTIRRFEKLISLFTSVGEELFQRRELAEVCIDDNHYSITNRSDWNHLLDLLSLLHWSSAGDSVLNSRSPEMLQFVPVGKNGIRIVGQNNHVVLNHEIT